MSSKSPFESRRIYVFGPFRMDVAERRLSRDGSDIALTRKTFDLLLALIESAGHLRTRETLIDTLWPDTIVEEHSLTWNLSALRRALGDTGDAPRYIETVRGHGYRFMAAVHNEEEVIGAPWEPADDVPLAEPLLASADDAAAITTDADVDAYAMQALPAPPIDARTSRSLRTPLLALALLLGVIALGLLWRSVAERTASPPDTAAPLRSIAVLPFENLSPDPANAYFASGMQDTILTKLAGIRDLRVVSRMSTESYKNHPADLAEVVRQLDVASVLEGSVQKAGDEVQINVQLIDGRSGSHLWAHAYTRTLDKVFEVQSDVAEQVASALQAKLLPAEANRVASLPTQDAQAYDLFLKAEYVALQIESGSAKSPATSTQQARAYYQQAIARDPHFALAFARLSYLESHAYWLDIDHTPPRAEAGQRAAEQALALDPELAQAHLAMGYAYYYGHRNYDAALGEFERALRDLPNNADINASIANIDRRRGQWQAALSGYERAAALDPRNPQWSILHGDTLTTLRRYDEAEAAYDRARAVDPENTAAALYKALNLLMAGDMERANATLAGLPRDADPEGLGSAIRFVAAWIANDADAALAVLALAPPSMDAPWTPGFVPTDLLRAQALELKGDTAAARQAYERARSALVATLQAQPDDSATLSLLGLALAGLGQKQAALDAGQRAVALLPLSQDAVDGPYYPATLAEIRIRVGDVQDALPLLRELLGIPAGRVMSAALVERDPRFASVRAALRGDTRR
jgi:TolB-like protein/DNA-binding winged helix-turn-helix (wHTH) protein/cytochrome c-type biogenesis protein CcmH/NrfG